MKLTNILALALVLALTACRLDWGPSHPSGVSDKIVNNPNAPIVGKSISSGSHHSCALRPNSSVYCWGEGGHGQLGNGSTSNALTPVDVYGGTTDSTPLDNITDISAGAFHTCALTTQGNVKCWGNGEYGQLGNNRTSSSPAPVDVQHGPQDSSPLRGIIAISAGQSHTCALTDEGQVKCWGNAQYGQLGEDTVSHQGSSDTTPPNPLPRPTPLYVHTSAMESTPLGGIVAISSGAHHTCALTSEENVKCWGSAYYGQLGNGKVWRFYSTPQDVHTSERDNTPLSGITAISAGGNHTCVLTDNAMVKCWGWRQYGQLGDHNISPIENASTPVKPHTSFTDSTPLDDISAINAGTHHTCAITNMKKVKCWGYGAYGQLGNRGAATLSIPVNVYSSSSDSSSLSDIIEISAGGKHTCALTTQGKIKCWGNGEHGQLGNGGTLVVNTTPKDISPDLIQ